MSRAFCSHIGGSFGAFVSVDGGGDEIGCGGAWARAVVETQASSSATQRMVRLLPKVGGGTLGVLRAPSSGEAELPRFAPAQPEANTWVFTKVFHGCRISGSDRITRAL